MKRKISNIILKLFGWKIVGDLPKDKKYLIVFAPHTSNWDFIFGRCFGYQLNIYAKFLGKSQLFQFPFGWFFRWMGGIPVNRAKSNNLVTTTIDLFNNSEYLVLGIAPEGTRSWTNKWKLGFYHIAVGANIPIMLSFLDYEKKEAGIGLILHPSGKVEEDLQKIQSYYEDKTPKFKEKYNPKIF